MVAQVEHSDAGEVHRHERRPVSTKTVIEAAKEAVKTVDLAELLCGPGALKRIGEKWKARCPLPDHEERTPSFVVYPNNDSWYCFGCLKGGDVIDLARFAWGYERHELAMAAADLLREYGHEVPSRPPAWFRKQARQKPIRDAIEEAKLRHIQRRVFRWFFVPLLEGIEDEDECRAEAEAFWDKAAKIAGCIRAGRGLS